MRPLAVRELFSFRERLGITGIAGPADSARPARRVLRYPDGTGGRHRAALLTQAVLIFSSAVPEERFREKLDGHPPAAVAVSCSGGASGGIPPFFQEYAERTQTPLFASGFDEWLLSSRVTGLLEELGKKRVMVHGTLVTLSGLGVLLTGESGIGKTSTALAAMAGDSRWVADDAVILQARAGLLYGRGHTRTRASIAVPEKGILPAGAHLGNGRLLDQTQVHLMVRLVRPPGQEGRAEARCRFVGVSIPCRELPVDVSPARMAARLMGWSAVWAQAVPGEGKRGTDGRVMGLGEKGCRPGRERQ
jgi:serine kinase of HPr protein (carbohydrate metabolism regulator)